MESLHGTRHREGCTKCKYDLSNTKTFDEPKGSNPQVNFTG